MLIQYFVSVVVKYRHSPEEISSSLNLISPYDIRFKSFFQEGGKRRSLMKIDDEEERGRLLSSRGEYLTYNK